MKPAKVRAKAAKLLQVSNGVTLGSAAPAVVHSVRRAIQELVPGDFHWWMEIDSEIGQSVRWVWLGHSAVTHVGGVSDVNVEILLSLLRGVNWFSERNAAIESVEGYEEAALKVAQERRRIRAIAHPASKLKEVQMPEPPPLSLEGKLVVHRVGIARAGYAAAVDEKTRRQKAEAASRPVAAQIKSYKSNRNLPQYGVTTSKSSIISTWEWEVFESREEVQERLASEPEDTFTHICVYGFVQDNVNAWRKAWIDMKPIRELESMIFEAEGRGEDVSELCARLQEAIRAV